MIVAPLCRDFVSTKWSESAMALGITASDHETSRSGSANKQDVVRRLSREIASLNVHLEEIHQFWARALGITGPQWTILTAVADMDRENGVSVNGVSKVLHVDSPFVTTQSKVLEKQGFLRRKPSSTDARVVLMSLTDKASHDLASLTARQESLREFIFEEIGDHELIELIGKLGRLKRRLEKACLKVALEF
jgi:DNA-binding MarR family transcriptional regulator